MRANQRSRTCAYNLIESNESKMNFAKKPNFRLFKLEMTDASQIKMEYKKKRNYFTHTYRFMKGRIDYIKRRRRWDCGTHLFWLAHCLSYFIMFSNFSYRNIYTFIRTHTHTNCQRKNRTSNLLKLGISVLNKIQYERSM